MPFCLKYIEVTFAESCAKHAVNILEIYSRKYPIL